MNFPRSCFFSNKAAFLLFFALVLRLSQGYGQQGSVGRTPAKTPAKKVLAKPHAPRPVKKVARQDTLPKSQLTKPEADEETPDQRPVLNENDPEYLRRLEAQNTALLKSSNETAIYYRMDRSSFTVLPVIISVPGLGETTKERKPIYQPHELFQRHSVKPVTGDVLVSTKHYYNKIKFDTYKLFTELMQDSTNFYALTGLRSTATGLFKKTQDAPQKNTAKIASGAANSVAKKVNVSKHSLQAFDNNFGQTEQPLDQKIREALVGGNVATNVLNIWTNKVILMRRIMFSQGEADKRQRVDPKKLAVWEKLLRKNYVLVLAMLEPHKVVRYVGNRPVESYVTGVRGFLYHVDTTRLNINTIGNRHPLRFVGRVSSEQIDCDPRSEEIVERMQASTLPELQTQVKKLMAADFRPMADQFYKEKSFQCARNYYEYILSTAPDDAADIRKRLEVCQKQLARTKTAPDNTCLANETAVFQDWLYAQSATNEAIQDCERNVGDLQAKATIVQTKPYITAEIGRKQGIYTDQRFLVYRKTIDEAGSIGQQRVGTLRVVKVGNNMGRFSEPEKQATLLSGVAPPTLSSLVASAVRRDTAKVARSSQKAPQVSPKLQAKQAEKKQADSLMQADLKTMSIFKQTDGIRIEPFDLIRQQEDYGFGVQVGYGLRLGVPAFSLGADIRLGQVLRSRIPLSGLKLGVNLAFLDKKALEREWDIPEDNSTIIEIYLARELYLSPKFDLKPFVGVSTFNERFQLLIGGAASINLTGRNSNTKVRLAPELGYMTGYTYQATINLKFDF